MTKTKLFFSLLLGIIAITAVIQVTASNYVSTDGIDLAQIQNKEDALKKENILLREKIYARASLTEVASEAATLGFVPQDETVFLDTARPIAIKP
jgi:hypothetical protein